MTAAARARLSGSRWSGLVAVALVTAVVSALAADLYIVSIIEPDRPSDLAFSMGVAFFTFVGALIVWRQPQNRIGWLFSAIGVLWVTGDLAGRYSTYAHTSGRGNDLLMFVGAWYGEWYWLGFLMLTFSLLPQLFPTGAPMHGRWRTLASAVGIFTLTAVLLAMFEDRLHVIGTDDVLHNPFGIAGFHDLEEGFTALPLFVGAVLSLVGGAAAVVTRFRRSRGDERQQLKWFTVAVLALVLQFVGQSAFSGDEGHAYPWLDGLALALVPISAAVAIFRYRLYDIDLVINRALVYGLLSAVLVGSYLGIVVLLQRIFAPFTADSDVAVAGSTLAVAALFRPLRARVQAFIDRRFYRHKYDATETLDVFSARLRDQVDLDALNHELVGVVAKTMQPAHVSVWLRRNVGVKS